MNDKMKHELARRGVVLTDDFDGLIIVVPRPTRVPCPGPIQWLSPARDGTNGFVEGMLAGVCEQGVKEIYAFMKAASEKNKQADRFRRGAARGRREWAEHGPIQTGAEAGGLPSSSEDPGAAIHRAAEHGDPQPRVLPKALADMDETDLTEYFRRLAAMIDTVMPRANFPDGRHRCCFAMLVFDESQIGQYVGNVNRAEMIKIFRETADRLDKGGDGINERVPFEL